MSWCLYYHLAPNLAHLYDKSTIVGYPSVDYRASFVDMRCVAPNVVCVEGDHYPLFIHASGWFGVDKIGNHQKLPTHAAIQPSEQGGPERRCRGCRHTQGAGVPWLGLLATAFLQWSAGWAMGCFLGGARPSLGV